MFAKLVKLGVFFFLALALACQSEPQDTAPPTEGQIDSLHAQRLSERFRVSKTPTEFDACTLLNKEELAQRAQIKYPEDMLIEPIFQQAGKSTCMFTWDQGRHSIVLQVEFNQKIEQAPQRYTKYLNHLLEKGEPADRNHPDSLHRFELVSDAVGTPAIWSATQRSLRWHVENIYHGFMYLTHTPVSPTEAAADSILLTALAASINQQLPQDQE